MKVNLCWCSSRKLLVPNVFKNASRLNKKYRLVPFHIVWRVRTVYFYTQAVLNAFIIFQVQMRSTVSGIWYDHTTYTLSSVIAPEPWKKWSWGEGSIMCCLGSLLLVHTPEICTHKWNCVRSSLLTVTKVSHFYHYISSLKVKQSGVSWPKN